MIKRLLLIIVLIHTTTNAQTLENFEDILNSYPKNLSAKGLAGKILKDFSSDKERAEAAFYWVAHNIRYNLSAYREGSKKVIGFRYRNEEEKRKKLEAIKDSIVQHTLETKKAVCEGYAQTLAKIYTHLGLENKIVKGYVRNSIYDIGKEQELPNHAWNAVKIKKEWKIIDATWAAGSVINGRWQQHYDNYYYDIPKKHLLKTHYPVDKDWKFGEKLSKREFYNQPIYATEFLQTNMELITPTRGMISVQNINKITLKVRNLVQTQKVLYGISSNRFAQKPEVSFRKDMGIIEITSFNRSNRLYLVIDGNVCVEFRLI